MSSVATITPDALAKSAGLYRKELLMQPVHALAPALNYFTLRTGIRESEMVGELSGDFNLRPYNATAEDTSDFTITGRKLQTYLGSIVKKFDPNSVRQSIYGSAISKGDELKDTDIVMQILAFCSAKIGESLGAHLFDATRNDSGTTTSALFDGIDTITKTEITNGKITPTIGNRYDFTAAITDSNAVDSIVGMCRAANEELLNYQDGTDEPGSQLNLIVPQSIIWAYRDDYKSTTGSSPVYDKFNQTVVEGFPNIHLVPFIGKKNAKYIQLTSRKNMLVGMNLESDMEDIRVEKHHAFLLDFIATLYFGVNYESIAPQRLLVGKLYEAPSDDGSH